MSEVLQEAISSDEAALTFTLPTVSFADLPTEVDQYGDEQSMPMGKYLLSQDPALPTDSAGYLIIDKKITLELDSVTHFQLSMLRISTLDIKIKKATSLYLGDCHFDTLDIQIDQQNYMHLSNNYLGRMYIQSTALDRLSEWPSTLWLQMNRLREVHIFANDYENIDFTHNQFELGTAGLFDGLDSALAGINNTWMDYGNASLSVHASSVGNVFVWGNSSVESVGEKPLKALEFRGNMRNLKIEENHLAHALEFVDLEISERLEIIGNKFNGHKGLGLYRVLFPGSVLNINWNQLSGNLLYVKTDLSEEESPFGFKHFAALPFFGTSVEEMKFDDRVRVLLEAYSRFHGYYKASGDILAANAVYRELQAIHTLRYEHMATTEGGLRNVFRWRLSQLTRVYTGYGTEPSRALVMSLYIIICFAIVYFFYPSEWDKEPKSKMWANLKVARDKNEEAFARPLAKFAYHLFLSFFNAFTLSVNSFVTLGFGAIPTRGLARYLCIIEGLIGWLLLSLFLVALINQVNF